MGVHTISTSSSIEVDCHPLAWSLRPNRRAGSGRVRHVRGNQDEEDQPTSRAHILSDKLGIPIELAADLVDRQPQLLSSSAQTVVQASLKIEGLLSVSRLQAMRLLGKDPDLVDMEEKRLSSQLEQMVEELDVSYEHVARLVLHSPVLLRDPPVTTRNRLQGMARVLDIPLGRLLDLSHKHPTIIRNSQQMVKRYVRLLHSLVQLTKPQAVKVLVGCPSLLCSTTASLKLKLTNLLDYLPELTQQSVGKLLLGYPKILEYSTNHVCGNLTKGNELFGRDNFLRIIQREPSMLVRKWDKMCTKIDRLKALMGISEEEVIWLVERRPALLSKSVASVAGTYQALSIWSLDPQYKLAVILAHPVLLRLDAKELRGRCRWLRSFMMSSAYFHATVRRLPPQLVGVLLSHLVAFWSRLQFLSESDQGRSVDIMQALRCHKDEFCQIFPEYQKWLQWQRNLMEGAEVPWRRGYSDVALPDGAAGLRQGAGPGGARHAGSHTIESRNLPRSPDSSKAQQKGPSVFPVAPRQLRPRWIPQSQIPRSNGVLDSRHKTPAARSSNPVQEKKRPDVRRHHTADLPLGHHSGPH